MQINEALGYIQEALDHAKLAEEIMLRLTELDPQNAISRDDLSYIRDAIPRLQGLNLS